LPPAWRWMRIRSLPSNMRPMPAAWPPG
jgi:hypothetical protein